MKRFHKFYGDLIGDGKEREYYLAEEIDEFRKNIAEKLQNIIERGERELKVLNSLKLRN